MNVIGKWTTTGELSGELSMIASRRIHDEQLRKVAESLRQPFLHNKDHSGRFGPAGVTGTSSGPGKKHQE
jgi:hypothetical protein